MLSNKENYHVYYEPKEQNNTNGSVNVMDTTCNAMQRSRISANSYDKKTTIGAQEFPVNIQPQEDISLVGKNIRVLRFYHNIGLNPALASKKDKIKSKVVDAWPAEEPTSVHLLYARVSYVNESPFNLCLRLSLGDKKDELTDSLAVSHTKNEKGTEYHLLLNAWSRHDKYTQVLQSSIENIKLTKSRATFSDFIRDTTATSGGEYRVPLNSKVLISSLLDSATTRRVDIETAIQKGNLNEIIVSEDELRNAYSFFLMKAIGLRGGEFVPTVNPLDMKMLLKRYDGLTFDDVSKVMVSNGVRQASESDMDFTYNIAVTIELAYVL